jgi:hypothetical protein
MKMIETANVQNEEVLKFFQSEHITIWKSKVASGEWVLLPRLSEEEKSAVDEFSSNCIPVKMAETGHQKDPKREYIRIYNGKCAEWALMKHLGLEPPDMTIGDSRLHMGKDIELFGEKFGIKCSVVGQAALVFKKPVMPEIILVQRNDDYYLCGIASMKVMRENNDIKLMKSALNSQKAGLTMEGYGNLQQLEGTLRYLKLRNATSKTTGLTVQKTCEQFVELYGNKEFKAMLDGHAATQKAFEK